LSSSDSTDGALAISLEDGALAVNSKWLKR